MTRSVFTKQLEQHADEAVGHVGGFVRDRARHRGSDRVVRTEELCVAVDDVERRGWLLLRHAGIVVATP